MLRGYAEGQPQADERVWTILTRGARPTGEAAYSAAGRRHHSERTNNRKGRAALRGILNKGAHSTRKGD